MAGAGQQALNNNRSQHDVAVPLQEARTGPVLHDLSHYQQKSDWDCGLSCVLMVLEDKDKSAILHNMDAFIEGEGFGKSTWTIDLCYILYRFKINFRYTTTTMGVDPGYVKEVFYDKVLSKDSDRVTSRFQRAPSLGMRVDEESVSLDTILSHLLTQGPIIVLTNANLLHCSDCRSNFSPCSPCFSPSRKSQYQGHYIVLVGFDDSSREIKYRNPTLRDKICMMPYDILEEARTAYGTDEDVIFIHSTKGP